ncbi:MAG: DUF4157 domain-containing protein [Pyrinomonadaceae bacterium]
MRTFAHQQGQAQKQSSGQFSPARSPVLARSRERSLVSNSRDNETVSSPLVNEVLRSPGHPLDASARSFMEPRFGHDFSRVRVHTDAAAAESAREVGASAYTVGSHIVFAQGGSASALNHDRHLLAHELAHVVQQREVGEASSYQSDFPAAPKHAEQSADVAASAVAAGGSAPPQPGQSAQLARQGNKTVCDEHPELCPAPAAGSRPIDPSRPPPSVKKEPERKTETPSPAPPEKKATPKPRSPVGTNSMFKENTPTKELARWDYIVYEDHVRLGNRAVDESKSGVVIGSWPWMTNNPGDLTGNLSARQEDAEDPKSPYRKDERIWGRPTSRGESPTSLKPVAGSVGLDAGNTAVEGFAARKDLAIFANIGRGRKGLKDWIQKYYGDVTLAESVKKHLGPTKSHVKGVDDPEKYPKRLQEYLTDKGGYPSNYVTSTKGKDVKDDAWNDVIDAFGYAEGFYNRRPVAGEKGKFRYYENKGIIYRCGGRDPIDVDPAFKDLKRVTSMPQATPPEVKKLLGCE